MSPFLNAVSCSAERVNPLLTESTRSLNLAEFNALTDSSKNLPCSPPYPVSPLSPIFPVSNIVGLMFPFSSVLVPTKPAVINAPDKPPNNIFSRPWSVVTACLIP